jgi:hypothetical protein
MAKKIDETVLEKVRLKCYEVALMGIINEQTMEEVKEVAFTYLSNNGYERISVKCDFENNPPDIIDRNNMIIEIFESEFPGSSSYHKHLIIL